MYPTTNCTKHWGCPWPFGVMAGQNPYGPAPGPQAGVAQRRRARAGRCRVLDAAVKNTRRWVGYPPNLIKLLGRPHPTSMGGETEQSGAV